MRFDDAAIHHQSLRVRNSKKKAKKEGIQSNSLLSVIKSSNQISAQDEDLECSPDHVTTDRAEAINSTSIKHEGIKNDISQFQIKVTKIPNALEAISYDFENKVRTSVNAHNVSKISSKDRALTRNYIYKAKISKLDFKRLSLKDSREFKRALGL